MKQNNYFGTKITFEILKFELTWLKISQSFLTNGILRGKKSSLRTKWTQNKTIIFEPEITFEILKFGLTWLKISQSCFWYMEFWEKTESSLRTEWTRNKSIKQLFLNLK